VLGLLGGDDILAAFIVGNSFTWDDYYRLETEDSAFQDVLDALLNTGRSFGSDQE
jgi:NhaP-type Na+/H+ or K+/H+ antiporter